MSVSEPITYRPEGGLEFAPAILAIGAVIVCIALIASAVTGGGPWWLALLFLIIIGLVAIKVLPMNFELVVANGVLSWRSAVARTTVPLSDVVQVRYVRSAASFELSDGRDLRIQVTKGWMQFLDALAHAYPEHQRLRAVR